MIRPLMLILATLFLASCAPTTTPAHLYTSQNYAEKVSEGFYRLPDTFDRLSRDRLEQQRNTVVPVKAGETVVVERPSTLRGRLLVGLPRDKEKASVLVHDETDQYSIEKMSAPEGWTAEVALERQTVRFSSLVNGDDFYWVDMGGEYEIEGRGASTSSTAVHLSVPESAQPGRYFFEATFKAENKKKLPPHIAFIVEVL